MTAPLPRQTVQSLSLRRALSQFTTGITIVTTCDQQGIPIGLTVNSFSSVSLEPPLILWCLSLRAGGLDTFRNCKHYVIHVLSADQLALAQLFSTRGSDRFGPQSGTQWRHSDTQLPRLQGCLAWFECANRSQYLEGDHMILVGQINAYEVNGGAPLAFHDGRYIARPPTEAA